MEPVKKKSASHPMERRRRRQSPPIRRGNVGPQTGVHGTEVGLGAMFIEQCFTIPPQTGPVKFGLPIFEARRIDCVHPRGIQAHSCADPFCGTNESPEVGNPYAIPRNETTQRRGADGRRSISEGRNGKGMGGKTRESGEEAPNETGRPQWPARFGGAARG
jgi:hypothetical protein